MLTLQILYPHNVLYTNEPVVGAGAFDDAIKRWIESRAPGLEGALPSVPYTAAGELPRMVVASKKTDDHGGGNGGGRPGSRSAGGGGGGGSSGDGGLLAAALDSTKLPDTKGGDGHACVAPLPKGMLPTAQAELLVAKRSILESAVSLGQTPAGPEACANLGEIHGVVDPDSDKPVQQRFCDPLLNWAMAR